MTADLLVTAARGWLGVPFMHQGRSSAGVDCAGLVICLGRDLGQLPADFDVNGYTRQPDGSMFAHCAERLLPSPARVGAVALMRFTDEPQHLGILVPYRHGGLAIVHALQSAGRVVEHRLDANWRARIVRCFSFPGITE